MLRGKFEMATPSVPKKIVRVNSDRLEEGLCTLCSGGATLLKTLIPFGMKPQRAKSDVFRSIGFALDKGMWCYKNPNHSTIRTCYSNSSTSLIVHCTYHCMHDFKQMIDNNPNIGMLLYLLRHVHSRFLCLIFQS